MEEAGFLFRLQNDTVRVTFAAQFVDASVKVTPVVFHFFFKMETGVGSGRFLIIPGVLSIPIERFEKLALWGPSGEMWLYYTNGNSVKVTFEQAACVEEQLRAISRVPTRCHCCYHAPPPSAPESKLK